MPKETPRKEKQVIALCLTVWYLTTQIPTAVLRFASSGLDKAPHDSAISGAPKTTKAEVISWFFRNGFRSSDRRQHSGTLNDI